jgi:hypothetical protein
MAILKLKFLAMNLPQLYKARVIADYGEQLLVSVNDKQFSAGFSAKLFVINTH